jgi:hypothetical protein
MNTGHCQALQNLSRELLGMVGANVYVKTIADCPSEELQVRVWPVLRCWAKGFCRLKGGRFSRHIIAGRAGKGRDVMESGISVTMGFLFAASSVCRCIVKALGTIRNDPKRPDLEFQLSSICRLQDPVSPSFVTFLPFSNLNPSETPILNLYLMLQCHIALCIGALPACAAPRAAMAADCLRADCLQRLPISRHSLLSLQPLQQLEVHV